MIDELLTAEELAKLLRCSLSSINRRVESGTLPRPLQFGTKGKRYWKVSAISDKFAA